MNNQKLKIIGIVGAIVIVVLALIYLLFGGNKSPQRGGNSEEQNYPTAVRELIDHPIQRNENWSTLVSNDDFILSYATADTGPGFYITINNHPIEKVAKEVEKYLLEKFDNNEEQLCEEYVVIGVPFNVNEQLSDYDFGLSFCPNRIHITDVSYTEINNKSELNTNFR